MYINPGSMSSYLLSCNSNEMPLHPSLMVKLGSAVFQPVFILLQVIILVAMKFSKLFFKTNVLVQFTDMVMVLKFTILLMCDWCHNI